MVFRRQLLELLEKTEQYLAHKSNCSMHINGECDCGLFELRKQIKKILKDKKNG